MSLHTSYKMVCNPVDYANACMQFNRPSVYLAPSQPKSNLLWSLAGTPLRLEPWLIYCMRKKGLLNKMAAMIRAVKGRLIMLLFCLIVLNVDYCIGEMSIDIDHISIFLRLAFL